MKHWIKNKRSYHEFSALGAANDYLDENPDAVIVSSLPKGTKPKKHSSVGEPIIEIPLEGGEINAFHREGLQTDVWNCIVEGETQKQFEERIVNKGLSLKKARNYFSQFKSKGWVNLV